METKEHTLGNKEWLGICFQIVFDAIIRRIDSMIVAYQPKHRCTLLQLSSSDAWWIAISLRADAWTDDT